MGEQMKLLAARFDPATLRLLERLARAEAVSSGERPNLSRTLRTLVREAAARKKGGDARA